MRVWAVIFFFISLFGLQGQASSVLVEHDEKPYLFDWTWEPKPESITRIPSRGPASGGSISEDQPLRVQKRLPSYRHYRSPAQVHWEAVRELQRESAASSH